jgi:hypothetical protein
VELSPLESLAMPRQPLLYVRSNAKYRFAANSLEERPELAGLIAQCISIWSNVEAHLAALLSAIMKADTAIASAVFLSIRNSRAQREALGAAAQIGLTGRELEMFEAIGIIYQTLDAQRTDLAHGIFAVSDDMPDAILWIESAHFTRHNLEMWKEISTKPPQLGAPATDEAVKDDLFVYRKDDLTKLRDEIKEFWLAVFLFHFYLKMRRPAEESAINEAQFQKLYTLPQIQRALVRLREG